MKWLLVAFLLLAAGSWWWRRAGPLGFRAQYEREVRARLATPAAPRPLSEADLDGLPAAVQRYLRVTGSVGQPRVHHVRTAWRGRIRGAPDDPWMEFTAEQHDFIDEPARFFLMRAKRGGLPVHVLHAYHGPDVASMRVRLLGLFPMVDARGPEMRQAETVTVFNDLSLFAPGALIDPRIHWEEIDAHRVRGAFTSGAHTVTAELVFDDAGELVDWVSDDRLASVDGKKFERRRWSTPLYPYRAYGPFWLSSGGEGRWHASDGDWSYIQLEMVDHEINGPGPGR